MSYLIRVILPDAPGGLGKLSEAFGESGANIQSVDIVQRLPNGTVIDDIVVQLPPGVMADRIVSAAMEVDGVDVDSIRPFSGQVDRRGQIEMLARVARHARNIPQAMSDLVQVLPQTMTASWALVLDVSDTLKRVAASEAAPADDGTSPANVRADSARILNAEEETWIPESWTVLDSALAIAPLVGTQYAVVVARPGGPDFLAGEVAQLGEVGMIVGAMLRTD